MPRYWPCAWLPATGLRSSGDSTLLQSRRNLAAVEAHRKGHPHSAAALLELAEAAEDAPAEQTPCSKATAAIVVEGPGKRGEVVHVCADPKCEVHGKPNYRAEQEAAERERQKAWKRQQEQQLKNRENNRRLFVPFSTASRKL